jgi:hypothetical protein
MAQPPERLVVDDREINLSNPDKVLFPEAGHTKRDLVRYYLAVASGALRAAGGRPNVLVRYPNGIGAEFFYQKRAPQSRPPWVEVVTLSFPSGRTAQEVVPRDAATLAWMANLACLELHPHPVRADDLDHPDELRVDLDPVPGVPWSQIREVENIGLARGAHLRAHRAHVDVSGRPAGRARVGTGGRAARAGARHEQVVERGTSRRVSGLQPERQGSDDCRRLLGAAEARRARLGAGDVGGTRRVRPA